MLHHVYSALSGRIRHFREHVLAAETRRNRWTRLACRLLGIVLLVGVIGVGMVICWLLSVLITFRRLLGGKASAPSRRDGHTMEGQYRVVDRRATKPPATRKTF